MELKQAFETVMSGTTNMALATSVNGKPNVRVVTYGYDKTTPSTVYFTTFKGNQKISEFEENPHVAIIPLPESPDAPAQVRIHGQVAKSGKSLADIAPLILKNAPFFAETLAQGGDMLVPYEIYFNQAAVTIGMQDAQILLLP